MIDPTLNQKRAIAGAKGGRKTVRRYGKRYMRKLASWGAHRMHTIYQMVPVGLNDFALVHRETGEVKALLSGRPVDALTQSISLPGKEDPYGLELL